MPYLRTVLYFCIIFLYYRMSASSWLCTVLRMTPTAIVRPSTCALLRERALSYDSNRRTVCVFIGRRKARWRMCCPGWIRASMPGPGSTSMAAGRPVSAPAEPSTGPTSSKLTCQAVASHLRFSLLSRHSHSDCAGPSRVVLWSTLLSALRARLGIGQCNCTAGTQTRTPQSLALDCIPSDAPDH